MSVPVAVRVRPLNRAEKQRRCETAVVPLSATSLRAGRSKTFSFDHVYGPDTEQDRLYNSCVRDLVSSCFEGYNATIMAYGQTGTGKTYTMGQGGLDSGNIGVMQLAAQQIFDYIAASMNKKISVVVSYVEIYMESVVDLLDPERVSLQIRETEAGGTILIGVSEREVFTAEEFLECLARGGAARQVNSTTANNRSSRSHAILSVMLEIEEISSVQTTEAATKKKYSQLQFVDLAGSERSKATQSRGTRLKEAIYINGGLLALGNVVSALSTKKRRKGHIPYRDSKLTRLLKSSIGGNSKTIMILCVGPTDEALNESLCTLKYGSRARAIQNDPKINYDPYDEEMHRMKSEIARLQTDLHTQKIEAQRATSTDVNEQDILEMSECIAPVIGGLGTFLPPAAHRRLLQILNRHGIEVSAPDPSVDPNIVTKSQVGLPKLAFASSVASNASWYKTSAFNDPVASQIDLRESQIQKKSPAVDQPEINVVSDVRIENLQAEIAHLRQQLVQSESSLREDEEIFAKKCAEIEALTQENSNLRCELTRMTGSESIPLNERRTTTPWQTPFTLGHKPWLSPRSSSSPDPAVATSLVNLMDQVRLQQHNMDPLDEDMVMFGETLDETIVGSPVPSTDIATGNESCNSNSSTNKDHGQTIVNFDSPWSIDALEDLNALLDHEVDSLLREAKVAVEESKISELLKQHWELGIQRDSVQLEKIRKSQIGGFICDGENDELDSHLEQITDEIVSMEATIDYRNDKLKKYMDRPSIQPTAGKNNAAVDAFVSKCSKDDACRSLKEVCLQVVKLRIREEYLCGKLEEKDVELQDLSESQMRLEQSLKDITNAASDKIDRLEKENSKLKVKLTQQPAEQQDDTKVAELSKSLYYYKKRSRELRRMLEACTAAGVVVNDPGSGQSRSISPEEVEVKRASIRTSDSTENKSNATSSVRSLGLKGRRGTYTMGPHNALPTECGQPTVKDD